MYITPDRIDKPLHVVTAISNPIRYKSRWKLYQRFAKHVADAGAILHVVELAYGERHHALESDAPKPFQIAAQHIRLRTSHELWHKENLINIGIERLPCDWKYVAWIDADILFARPNWVGETIHQLQHFKLVQMFSHAQDLAPSYEPMGLHKSFMACVEDDDAWGGPSYGSYGQPRPTGPHLWHPGFAWAARREAVDQLGQLIDYAILGAGDNHMAHALIGRVDDSCHPGMHAVYRRRLHEWQHRAETLIRRNVGCVRGLILHYWHGKKRDRRYWDRWQILVRNQFNPDLDLKYDWQGVLQLVDRGEPRSLRLRDEVRAYFRQRNEDSVDAE